MILALIQNNLVTSVVSLPVNVTDSVIQLISTNYQNAIDITNQSPTPQIGWVLSGNQIVPPAVQSWRISRLAMLQRFSLPERLGVLTYVAANPISIPAVLLQNIQAAEFVDLSRIDTISGIGALASLGLITSDRASAILNTAPSPQEIFQG